jgi:hypothetical protein
MARVLLLSVLVVILNSCEMQYCSDQVGRRYYQTEQLELTGNNIFANPDGSQDFTTIAAALASITDNSITNQYNIYITGTFNEYGLSMKHYVNIIGFGPSVSKIVGYLPASSPEATIQTTSTIDCDNINCTLQNFYVSIQNGRYAIHSDGGNVAGNPPTRTVFNNLTVDHLGNAEADAHWGHEVWSSKDAFGMGLTDNMTVLISGGAYETVAAEDDSRGIAIHSVTVAAAPTTVTIENVSCKSAGTYAMRLGFYYNNQDEYYFTDVSLYGDLSKTGVGTYTDNTTEVGTNPIVLNGNIICD